jgi:predicted NUDIX family phosphoesterase
VGRVHVGLIFLVEGDRPEISIREVDKLAGALFSLEAMRSYYLDMESWSQLIFDYLTGVPVA